MSNFYDSSLDLMIDSEFSYKADLCQFVTKAKNLYTDDASFTHKKECMLYINDTLTEVTYFYDSINALNNDLRNRGDELSSVFYDHEERIYNEMLILFKVR